MASNKTRFDDPRLTNSTFPYNMSCPLLLNSVYNEMILYTRLNKKVFGKGCETPWSLPEHIHRGAAAIPEHVLPIFLYGKLISSQLLAEVLTCYDEQISRLERKKVELEISVEGQRVELERRVERKRVAVETQRKRAILHSYSRHNVRGANYPAILETGPADRVEGYLYFPTADDFKRLDDFENELYRRDTVEVVCDNEIIEAFVYVWCDDPADLDKEDWNYLEFESNGSH